ncbi:alpha-2-macroglobulin receptor-associated protein [Drosophila rhopaloa]|uniref:Alpha-2-macroglobulin receptor-associated protein n=1 Tax=Drosophila rhopaloa TaxID=1041015 RepID=A0A6P4EKQ8_DRORH|nr:alpha-2-macroglobulin receptor-associated protein [Drosophila rhopaloa]
MFKSAPVIAVLALVLLIASQGVDADKKQSKKYSKEANSPHYEQVKKEKYDPDFKSIQRPFRMAKLNLVWAKAQNRLTEPKLKSLYMELKIHDKEEIAWKQLNSQHKDKDGLKDDELRRKLIGIMSSYDLLEHFDDTQDSEKLKPYKKFHDADDRHKNKSLFKDKKLNRLWEKAEISGFTAEELKSLKQEFEHHQDKVDVYYSLLENIGTVDTDKHENAINTEDLDNYNLISNDANENEIKTHAQNVKSFENDLNTLRGHHVGIKDHYDRLERLVSSGPHSQDFIEPKVQGLWRVAKASNFTEAELESIKTELHHFESRLLKLRHLHAEHALHVEKYKGEKHKDKSNRFEEMEDQLKKQTRKVEKLQEIIEQTIFKHTEL